MVTLNLSYTSPINPPSATPALTVPQIWAGLQRKIRNAQEFVPVIQACKVLKDEDGIVTRIVRFKEGAHRDKQTAKEVVRCYEYSWVRTCVWHSTQTFYHIFFIPGYWRRTGGVSGAAEVG